MVNLVFCALISAISINAQTVRVIPRAAKERIDIEIDGKLFTSYRWEQRIKRPVLLPIMTADGAFLTRGFPLETRRGETVGHPHQVGVALVYGDVNGVDFWNNSAFRTPKELEKMGRIVHRRILQSKSGKTRGELITQSEWLAPTGERLLLETTKFIFQANGKNRWIDRQTTLAANAVKVVFGDNKEGFFAVHLARELQQADQFPVKITDEKGIISEAKTNENLTGIYSNSENLTGNKIWGTLGKWASVTGKIGNEAVTVAVFDHPKNHNFPSSMMVRGYGLLALNPFGRKAFDQNAEARKYVLEPKQSIEFRHRLLILAEKASYETIQKEYQNFIK